jgi:hypothetical protein
VETTVDAVKGLLDQRGKVMMEYDIWAQGHIPWRHTTELIRRAITALRDAIDD